MFARQSPLTYLKSIPYQPLITGLTALRLLTAVRAGLVPDESYYWLWAQHPALGYYDHPPMVAWWIMAMPFTDASPLFVRLPFVLSFIALCGLVFDTAKTLFDNTIAKRALLWLNACVMLGVGSVIATPDPPSVLMWAGGLWALTRLQVSGKAWWWLVFGAFAGLGFEAKYTNLFLGLGVVVWLILDKDARKWLLSPWPYVGGVVAALLMAPNLIWNAQHGWLTFGKQFGRIEASHLTAQYLVEFLLSQPLLLNPLIFVFVMTGVMTWFKTREPKFNLLIALPLPLLAYLLIHVFHDRIQGNWPAPVYPGLIILAAASAETVTGKGLTRIRAWAAPFGITLSVIALMYLSFGQGLAGAAGLSEGWRHLSTQVFDKSVAANANWVATTDYDTQGELSYHLWRDHYISPVPMAERERYNWRTPHPDGKALIVVAVNDTPDLARCFSGLQDLGTVSRLKKPGKKSDFHLYTGFLKYKDCDVN